MFFSDFQHAWQAYHCAGKEGYLILQSVNNVRQATILQVCLGNLPRPYAKSCLSYTHIWKKVVMSGDSTFLFYSIKLYGNGFAY